MSDVAIKIMTEAYLKMIIKWIEETSLRDPYWEFIEEELSGDKADISENK